MPDTEIMQLVQEAGPYLTAAVGAYGASVLTRTEDAAADATVTLGRRILQALWHRQDRTGRAALEQAVTSAADDPGDATAATAVLLPQLVHALHEDDALRAELVTILQPQATGATGVRAGNHSPVVSHSRIGGDNIQIGQASRDVRIDRG
ncbi:hypothetical protein [Streptacidiphilus cavernicola]|uniref:Uncharacterized protein n=1 Tax=Streptacidiphilus cavernicola TaxID=3342716 RepID=A0ABV6VRV9_9ACTN